MTDQRVFGDTTTKPTVEDDRVDLWDLTVFAEGIPHDVFATLRRDDPVSWNPPSAAGSGFWSVVRHDDVVRINRDSEGFSSEARGIMMFDVPTLEGPEQPRMMIEIDPPRHTRYRRLVNRGFTPRMVGQLEAMMRAVARRALDGVAGAGRCDVAREVAGVLPVTVIAELLGVPAADQPLLEDLSERIQRGDEHAPAAVAIGELCAYANRLGADKRHAIASGAAPDDIVSTLLAATIDGDELTESEFDLFFLLLAVAGNETTRSAITGAVLAFIDHPEQYARLQEADAVPATAVDEVLRWTSPLRYMARTAVHDTEVRGRSVRAGEKVLLWYASANFDERVFDDPLRFDLERTPNEHLAFGGGGPHHCLGASLARLEIAVVLDEMRRRWSDLSRAGEPDRMRNSFANAITSLPITFRER
jgi:cholest-4-en-3-one 26-monooxygenase